MEKYCSNCGKELKENADICLNCGKIIKKSKSKIPGKGISIASMVLGIIATCWTLCEVVALEDIHEIVYSYYTMSEIIGSIIGYTLFALVPSIVGLILAGIGFSKKKNGFNISGLVLNIISLSITILIIIYILCLY